MELRQLTVVEFTEALASAAATPGGGSASALSGALAASLVAMVARNTGTAALEETATEAERLRAALVVLVDEDAAAFERVLAAFRLPKETPELGEARSRAIQAAYRGAVEPPLGVCRHALRVLALAQRVAELGNPNAVSDAGVAALLAAGALEGAALNVEINLGSIRDEAYRQTSADTVRDARADGGRLRDEALATVRAVLAR